MKKSSVLQNQTQSKHGPSIPAYEDGTSIPIGVVQGISENITIPKLVISGVRVVWLNASSILNILVRKNLAIGVALSVL
jgi:hypothetical protein